jgi:hypothetical protein
MHHSDDKITKWLSTAELLLRKGLILKVKYSDFLGMLADYSGKYYTNNKYENNHAIFLHTFCRTFIQQNTKWPLNVIYSKLSQDQEPSLVKNQQGRFIDAITDEGKDLWRINDPTKDETNKSWFDRRINLLKSL